MVVVTGALVDTLVGTGLAVVVTMMVGKDGSCDVVENAVDIVIVYVFLYFSFF